jgi:hypothetical protein
MSQSPSRCPKCDGAMEQGFVLDATHGGIIVSRWAAGVPRKSFWGGTKSVPQDQIFHIGVFRCESCGYLESYARPEFAAQ